MDYQYLIQIVEYILQLWHKEINMTKIIIYNQENAIPAIMSPTAEALEIMSILEIGIKYVPIGKPFKIIDITELTHLTDVPQETWIVDDTNLTDGVGTRID